MKRNRNYKEINRGKSTVIAAVCSFAAIILIIGLVLALNYDEIKRKTAVKNPADTSAFVSLSEIKESSASEGMRVDELTFFNHLGKEEGSGIEEESKEELPSEATDGKHTLITYEDGSSEWVSISPYLAKCEYDLMNLVNSNGKMKYFVNNQCVSKLGALISAEQNVVDFNKLKKAGIGFVMLRVNDSDASTGKTVQDEYLQDNLKRATDSGLEIGLYFESNALTEKEARAEADMAAASIGDYLISYPVAFMMDYAGRDSSEIDKLSRNEKTKLAKAFCNEIKDKGLTPIVYGDKARLMKYYDPSKLTDFDMCLIQTDKDIPDYPYRFTMWQYTRSGMVDGIARETNLILSFFDYASD